MSQNTLPQGFLTGLMMDIESSTDISRHLKKEVYDAEILLPFTQIVTEESVFRGV
jgi:hypothetical protein